MATWPERACTALTVYYERGVRALELLEEELWDEADSILGLRTAAFHNFRAADHLAQKEGYSEEYEQKLRSIWNQVCANDVKLMSQLKKARTAMEKEMARLAKVKATIGRFRSGVVLESDWENPV